MCRSRLWWVGCHNRNDSVASFVLQSSILEGGVKFSWEGGNSAVQELNKQ